MKVMRKKWVWAVYFFIIALNLVASVFFEPKEIGTWASIALSVIALVGLYGYMSERAFGARLFWAIYFYFICLVYLFYLTKNVIMPIPEAPWLVLSGLIMGTVLSLPLLFALWSYAFRSPLIWKASQSPSD
ncbi:MAG: hypothetical protein H0W24_08205 [Lysobacter sp.]|nr:hypothetical protein [Lysobacter sp.]MDQ3206370.1 hypothetical protein [Pseudomonadota bacterium]